VSMQEDQSSRTALYISVYPHINSICSKYIAWLVVSLRKCKLYYCM